MPKRTSAAKRSREEPVQRRIAIVTLDTHLAGSVARAAAQLRSAAGATITLHAASEWATAPQALACCKAAIAEADVVLVAMLFVEEHIQAIRPALEARREHCDALVCVLSAPEVSQLTRMGSLDMCKPQGGALAWLKRLRGNRRDSSSAAAGAGSRQMSMLRRLPQLLRFVPGTAQDLRVYFLAMRYWLLGSEQNLVHLAALLLCRYSANGELGPFREGDIPAPIEYPENGIYHPRLPAHHIATAVTALPQTVTAPVGTVGLIIMRSYVLAENTAHYDAVIEAFEQRGLRVVPVFSSGLDARPAVSEFLQRDGAAAVDAIVSLTGFSLVGGPAYNDADAAAETLSSLDVPYLSAEALEFQSLDQWQHNERGLLPLETMMMVAIPELDGATGTLVYGGRSEQGTGDLLPDAGQVAVLADRALAMVRLRQRARAERRVAVVLYDFPPNSGGTGSAASLAVFPSLFRTLQRLAAEGYSVEVPASVDELRETLLGGAENTGLPARVHARVAVDDHIAREAHLEEIEAAWGPAPGRSLADGRSLLVLGAQFGNVFVGVQPPFGYEGDPMRLMFEGSFAPTHAFSNFYRYLREDYAADAVVHFGTHGALEFMPGKQVGLSTACWPQRLIGALPNLYLYAANNPSEGAIAKRRSYATTLSYLTPAITRAGLYQDLQDLRSLVEQFRDLGDRSGPAVDELVALIRDRAAELELVPADDAGWGAPAARLECLRRRLDEFETTLIPDGLHVLGSSPSPDRHRELLQVMDQSLAGEGATPLDTAAQEAILEGRLPKLGTAEQQAHAARLLKLSDALRNNVELDALVHALDGGYVAPVPGGDLIRNPGVLPTGRNLHGFDPSRLPSAYAAIEGRRQAECLLAAAAERGQPLPRRIAMVLWGTDTLKNEGVGVAEALWLMGARARFDSYGRLAGAELVPLAELGRPRVDVVVSVSGIFRDLLPKQIQLLADAAQQCAEADEPAADNPIRQHALAASEALGVSLAEAALRVFGNAESAYGANVNQLVDSGLWESESELGDMFVSRRSFAYGTDGRPAHQPQLLQSVLRGVDLTFQNLDSVELGITTLDHYVDSLGGVSRAVENARGEAVPTLVGDYTQQRGAVRSLGEQITLETRTRMLNPRWYEGLLEHGYEGVHQIEAHITNTMGWSATTKQVAPWVYRELSRTFVLDEEMRERLALLNPKASLKLANRLIEAHERNYWSPDAATLEALQQAGDDLEDRLENVSEGAYA
ncbi:MAG: magnesium chelatase subunit H [Pseudomonadota bacterium]